MSEPKTARVRVYVDDRPADVADKFCAALDKLGVPNWILAERGDDWQEYEIETTPSE